MRELVIDISEHQGEGFDLARAKAEHGVYGVVIRCGGSYLNGEPYDDDCFEENYRKATEAGLHVGAYFYSTARTVGEAVRDAERTHAYCEGKAFDLPVYMDVEEPDQLAIGRDALTEVVRAYLDRLEGLGHWAGLYMSLSPFEACVRSWELVGRYAMWIAQYNDELEGFALGDEVGMWQFGGEVNFLRSPYINGVAVDQNWLAVDYPAKIAAAGLNGCAASDEAREAPEEGGPTPQERMVSWLLAQVGYVAEPGKHNRYAQFLDTTDMYNGPKDGFDWCDITYDCGMAETFGVDLAAEMMAQPKRDCGAGCPYSAQYYRDAGQFGDEPRPAAQIFFGIPYDEYHTGGVVGYDDRFVHVVEGNTGYGEGYSSGAVMRHTYERDDPIIAGYGYPRWELAGGASDDVGHMAEPRSNRDGGRLDEDGWGGYNTILDLQHLLGTPEDGKISGQDREDAEFHWAIVSVEYDDGDGSQLVRAIQRLVGAKVDGKWGRETSTKFQEWHVRKGRKVKVDGFFGNESVTATQKAINEGDLP